MASPSKRHAENAPGAFYVDRSCIDCGACRWIAPGVFAASDDHSYVARQPVDDAVRLRAGMALVACPTGSIGTMGKIDMRAAVAAFPEPIEPDVLFCGFTSEDSFGAASYLILRAEGNVLVDSPRAAGPLLSRIEALGGVRTMVLTHRDDVADHEVFRRRFGCERVMHEDDVARGTSGLERKIGGQQPVALAADLRVIPTPGHTRGHVVLLYRDAVLFSGDHLAWSEPLGHLYAFRDACWHSWEEQIDSMERLLDYDFERVLPGHGRPWRATSREAMRAGIQRCVGWMRRQ